MAFLSQSIRRPSAAPANAERRAYLNQRSTPVADGALLDVNHSPRRGDWCRSAFEELRRMSMKPIITKHYGLGLIVGIGFGLFLSKILIESGVVTDDASRRFMGVGGVVAMMVGGILYALSLRKPLADK